MAGSQRQTLRRSIEEILIPSICKQGFEVVPLDGEDARSREIRTSFPFGRLRRAVRRDLHLAVIQLDKHGAAFRINLGVAPPGGVEIGGLKLSQEQIWVHYLPIYFELYRNAATRRWFKVMWNPFRKDPTAAIRRLVEDVSGLLPEVEELFAEGKVGAHTRRVLNRE